MIKLTEKGRVQYISQTFRPRRFLRECLISMILDLKKLPKLSTKCSRESCVSRGGGDFPVNIPSTSLKSCFTLDVLNFSFK